jgi:hypothetical protein
VYLAWRVQGKPLQGCYLGFCSRCEAGINLDEKSRHMAVSTAVFLCNVCVEQVTGKTMQQYQIELVRSRGLEPPTVDL